VALVSRFLDNKRNSLIIFSLILIIFISIEFKGLSHIDPGDEYVYIYMGKLVAEGYVPYRDFFLAHPPLLVFSYALLYKLFGFKLFMFKFVELLVFILSSFFIYLIARHKFNYTVALLSVLFFLSSKIILFESTYFLGMGLTTLLFLIGLYYAINRNSYFVSGLFMALSALTRLNALVLIIAFILILFIKGDKKNVYHISFGFLLLFAAINFMFIIITGFSFIQSVYLFHLLKPAIGSTTLEIFTGFIKENFFLVTGFFLFIFSRKREISIFLILAFSYFVFLAVSKRIFSFYLVIVIPLLSIIAAYSVDYILKRYNGDSLIKYSIISLLTIIFIVNTSISVNRLYDFDFIDFGSFNEIKDYINDNSKNEDLLFGDATSAPLFALFTQRDIALNMPDTNIQLFQTGVVDIEDLIVKLNSSNVRFVIIRPLSGIGSIREFQAYLESECKLLKWFKDELQGDFLLYGCGK